MRQEKGKGGCGNDGRKKEGKGGEKEVERLR